MPPEIPTITPSQLTELFTSGKGKSKAVSGENIREKEGRGVIVVGKGTYLSTIQSFKNIAPIMDAALVDVDRSGQVSLMRLSCQLALIIMHRTKSSLALEVDTRDH